MKTHKLILLIGVIFAAVIGFSLGVMALDCGLTNSFIYSDIGSTASTFNNITFSMGHNNNYGIFKAPQYSYSRMIITDNNSIDFDITGFSYSIWVNWSLSGNAIQIIDKKNGGSANTGYWLTTNSAGTAYRTAITNNTGGGISFDFGNPQNTYGKWQLLTITFNATNNKTVAYINGTWQGERQLNFSGSYNSGSNLILGGNFNGSLDELRIYNKTLSQSDIQDIYNSGRLKNLTLQSDRIMLYYSFDNKANFSIQNLNNMEAQCLPSTIDNYLTVSLILKNIGYLNLSNFYYKMLSLDDYYSYIEGYNITKLDIYNSTFYSWNGSNYYNNITKTDIYNRSYIAFKDSQINVINSNFSYIGRQRILTNPDPETIYIKGLGCWNCNNSIIQNSYFHEVYSPSLLFFWSDNLTIKNNFVSGNKERYITGIYNYYVKNSIIENNFIINLGNNTYIADDSPGIWLSGNNTNFNISNNYVTESQSGIKIYGDASLLTIVNNTIIGSDGGGISLESAPTKGPHNNIIIDNTLLNNSIGLYFDGGGGNYNVNDTHIEYNVLFNNHPSIFITDGVFNTTIKNNLIILNYSYNISEIFNFTLSNPLYYTLISNRQSYFNGNHYYNRNWVTWGLNYFKLKNENIDNFYLENLTNNFYYLCYKQNGIICGTSDILNNNDTVDINLEFGDTATILDNFNLTEGITRENSPVTVSLLSDDGYTRKYTVISTLTQAVGNINFYPTASITCGAVVSGLTNTKNCGSTYIESITISEIPAATTTTLSFAYGSYPEDIVEYGHDMPTDLQDSCDGMLYCAALWAKNVTNGLFWPASLLAFAVVIFIASQRMGTTRAFAFSAFVAMSGSLWFATAQLMEWWIASIFLIVGAVSFVAMIISER